MSDSGNGGNGGSGFQARPAPGSATVYSGDQGQRGPVRDMWDQPIRQEPAPKARSGSEGGNPPAEGNDGSIDAADIDTIWDQVKKEGSKPADDGNPPNPAPVQKTPQQQMTEYLTAQGLDPIVLNDAEKAELKEGNFDNVLLKLNDKIVRAHTKALSSTQVMITEAVAAAVGKTKTEIQSQAAGEKNVAALNLALPFTKDKLIGPIAQTVMQRFLDRGASTEEAIKGVSKYYNYTADKMRPPVNTGRNGNFGAETNSEEDNGDGWIDMFRPKRQG